jgi:hypothetical protein
MKCALIIERKPIFKTSSHSRRIWASKLIYNSMNNVSRGHEIIQFHLFHIWQHSDADDWLGEYYVKAKRFTNIIYN